jgi:hypothetical protein
MDTDVVAIEVVLLVIDMLHMGVFLREVHFVIPYTIDIETAPLRDISECVLG